MKRTVLLSVFLVVCCSALSAQTEQERLVKVMAAEACTELSKTDLSNKSPDQVKAAIGIPLVQALGRHAAELTASGINVADQKQSEAFGQRVGIQLVGDCPAFIAALAKNPDVIKQGAANPATTGTISGTLLKIVAGDFSYLQVEDSKGKIEKLWWMEYFDGSKVLLTDPSRRLNKPINVKYTEKEVFNSTLGDYVKIKIITGIE
jgi:hypothetical protein